jgi:hypothetical protein
MEVICLEDEALYQLVEKVICHIIEKVDVKEDKWLYINLRSKKNKKLLFRNYEMKLRAGFPNLSEKFYFKMY